MTETRRIAICGGTFDPFHRGHLDPFLEVYDKFGWSRVIFLPAYRQPFKAGHQTASAFDRYAMAVLATEEDSRLEVSPLELERGGVSYTVDTAEMLLHLHPDASLEWIIGDDNLQLLTSWKDYQKLFLMMNFVVLRRGGMSLMTPELQGRVTRTESRPEAGAIVFADNEPVLVSSTEIRRRVRAGRSISGFVHPRVERYILQNRIYKGEVEN